MKPHPAGPHEKGWKSVEKETEDDFLGRGQRLMREALKNGIPEWDASRRKVFNAIARLGLGIEKDEALRQIGEACSDPGGESLFVRHGSIDCFLRFRSLFDGELTSKVRRSLGNGEFFRMEGGTENHKIMNAAAGLLTAETWPDWAEAAEVKNRCAAYLDAYFNRIVRYGQGEFDSTTYSVFYLTSLCSLYDFAQEPALRNKAGMMLDWYLANTAGDWLNGVFTGAHSRDYHPAVTTGAAPAGTASAWLYFGGRTPDFRIGEPHYSAICALSVYRVPAVIRFAAEERREAFEHRETHDVAPADYPSHDRQETRAAYGSGGALKGYGYISRTGVRKYTYVTPGYALGSMTDGKLGDVVWSGQLRRWSLDWDSDAPDATLFFSHPFPDFGYPEENYAAKWLGSSPYEQVVQHKDALLALYRIPPGTTYQYGPRKPFPSDRDPYVDGFFPAGAIRLLEEDGEGWIFAHGGSVLIAVKVAKPYVWVREGEDASPLRLRSGGLTNAVAVQTACPMDYRLPEDGEAAEEERLVRELGRFRKAVRASAALEAELDGEHPHAAFRSLSGDSIRMEFNGGRTVNGESIPYGDWPLVGNPFLHSTVGSGILEAAGGGMRVRWDYNAWTRTEEPDGGAASGRKEGERP